MSLYTLKRVLEASVRRQGEKPLTNQYLLNIVSMAMRTEEAQAAMTEQALNDMMGDDKKWGS